MKKQYIILLVAVLGLVFLDQLTKQLIASNLALGESIVVIKNFFVITSHRNDGAAWSIFSGQMTFLYIVTFFAAILFYYLGKDINYDTKKFYSIAITLMIAGAIGNFIDRIIFKEVIDFLDFYIFGYDFPTFNVADMCLVIGVIVFAVDVIWEDLINGKNKDREQSE
jgi:signal peptidase II